MIRVSVVNRVVFSFAHVACIGVFYFKIIFAEFLEFWRFFFLFPFSYKIFKPWVRAGSVIRRVRKIYDVVVFSDWVAFQFFEFRQLFAKLFTEILAAFIVVGKGFSEYGYGLIKMSA